jgi:hypothetical protein
VKAEQVKQCLVPFPPEVIKQKGGSFAADYVDHGHVTERLLQIDPEWTWEPCATDENGVPILVVLGQMTYLWGRMTVCGVTRIDVGSVETKKNEVLKEAVSDCIKRCAMRFGVALHLWMGEDIPDRKAAGSASGSRRSTANSPSKPSTTGPAATSEVTPEDLLELASRAGQVGVEGEDLRAVAAKALGRSIEKSSDIKTHEEIEKVMKALDAKEAA